MGGVAGKLGEGVMMRIVLRWHVGLGGSFVECSSALARVKEGYLEFAEKTSGKKRSTMKTGKMNS